MAENVPVDAADRPVTKTCPFCCESIAVQAIRCRHCGSLLIPDEQQLETAELSTDGIALPVLISASANILAGLFWLSTYIGIVFAVPMFILCGFEFALSHLF